MGTLFKTLICLMAFFSFSSQVMAQNKAQKEADKNTEQEGLFLRFIHHEKVALRCVGSGRALPVGPQFRVRPAG